MDSLARSAFYVLLSAALLQTIFNVPVVQVGQDLWGQMQAIANGNQPTPSGDQIIEHFDQWQNPQQ